MEKVACIEPTTKNYRRLLAVCLVSICALTAFAARLWTPDDDVFTGIPVNGAVNIQTQTLGIGHLQIRFTNPVVKMESVELNKRDWTMVTIDGETRLWQTGKPELPLISRAVRLPNTGNVELSVKPGEFDEYHNVDVMPQQPTDLMKGDDGNLIPVEYGYDDKTYSRDAWFPSDLAVLTNPQVVRDARVALLGVQPVQYNPVTRTLRVYKSIDVEILPVGGTGENELLSTISHAVPSYAGIYDEIIGCDDLADDARNALPGKFIIICRPNVVSTMQPFADWKTQSGHPTQIFATSLTSAQTIKDSIVMPAYNSTTTPALEGVILVGEGGSTAADYEMPTFTFSWGSTYYTDHYYGSIGTNIVASWWAGRMSCTSAQMLQTIVNRTLNYERIPYMGTTGSDTAWYNYGWGYAGTSNNIVSNTPTIQFCLQMMRARGLTNLLYDEHTAHVDANLINTRLSGGALFWAHRAGWISQITPSDVQGINNTFKPWVGFNITCDSGDWYGSGSTGMQEAITQLGTPAAPKGALCGMSTESPNTNPAHNNISAAGTFYGFGVKNYRQPGPMYFESKFQQWRQFWTYDQSNALGFILANNPMGDLSVNIWTGVPRAITANIPATLGIGQNRLELQVLRNGSPVSGALVAAWKKNAGGANETYTRAVSDDSGRVVLTLTNATAGNMLVTVTGNQVGQNLIPLIDTVLVTQSPTDLAFSNLTIQDDTTGGRSGNNNGMANPGETIDMNVQLINRGTSVATGISGTLVSTDSRITVINATRTWNNDSAGATVGTTSPFRIQLGTGFRDNENIPLRLNLTTTQGNRTISVPVTVRSILLAYMTTTLNPATFNPGSNVDLSLTVRNNGGLVTGATNATLFSLSPFVTVTTANATFTGLPIGSNASNPVNQLFHIASNGRTIPGTIARLGASFNAGAARDTVYFTVTVGAPTTRDPTGPDGYGYLAYDKTDTSYRTLAPAYNWVEIIPGYGGPGTRLPLSDNIISASRSSSDVSTVVRLPFTVRYYGMNYDSATICSNGWLAFGAQPYYQNSRNWHLPAFDGPRNLVAVNWCDQTNQGTNEGSYTYYDATNHRYIVSWKTSTLYSPTIGQEEYQLIVYDPAYNNTPTGDAPLKFQYKAFTPTPYGGGETGVGYSTIGIADNNYTNAIEYAWWNNYTPGSAPIPNGTGSSFAILFTTSQPVTGNVAGTVRRLSDSTPVSGATVQVLGAGRSAVTDSLGRYSMTSVQIGFYRIQAGGFGYNNSSDTVTIRDSSTATVNFLLTAPGWRLSVGDTTVRTNDSINVTLLDSGQTSTSQIFIRNTGNGPLTWNSQMIFSGFSDEADTLWNPVTSFNVTQACGGDQQISGVEFDGKYFWATGANNYNLPHHLYKLDRNGNLLRTFACPDSQGSFGWRDLSWDGRYLYGSYSNYIDKIDTSNGRIVQRYPVAVNPARAMAVDTAGGVIYFCDQASVIYKIRMSDGTSLGTLPNPSGGGVYGLAWYPADPDNMKLYAFVRDSVSHSSGSRVFKINSATGAARSMVTLGLPGEHAAGIAITPYWNPMFWNLVTVLQSTNSTRIALFELSSNLTWISFAPQSDSLLPGRWDTVTVNMNSRFMPVFRYRVGLRFNTNSAAGSVIVPVVMNVTHYDAVATRDISMPQSYSLEQNYPNPFNPVTTISFALPHTSPVKLTIYNELGREIARLIDNMTITAGRHTISFNGAQIASGVYFYRLEAGQFVSTKKMLLLK